MAEPHEIGIRIPPIPPIPTGEQPHGVAPFWDVCRPAANIYRNGFAIEYPPHDGEIRETTPLRTGTHIGLIIPAPTPYSPTDPGFPRRACNLGNPTGNSDIDFDHFILGWNPPVVKEATPPHSIPPSEEEHHTAIGSLSAEREGEEEGEQENLTSRTTPRKPTRRR